jgi:nitroreductase
MVEKLTTAAGYVPSGGNSHAYKFVVLTEGERRQKLEQELRRIYTIKRRIMKSPLLRKLFSLISDRQTRAFLRDTTYLRRISYLLDQYERGEDPVFHNAPLVIVVHSDALIPTPLEDGILAAYNIVLTGRTLGLGSCFVSLAQNALNTSLRCRKLLGMAAADRILAVVVLGYPAVQFRRPVPREPRPVAWIDN